MKISVFNTSSKIKVHKKTVKQIIKRVIEGEGCLCKIVNVIIADSVYLKKLNTKYLSKGKTTNVLAFDLDETFEVYVNYESARSTYELYYFIVHGLLHLVGYQHVTVSANQRMDNRCIQYLDTALEKNNHQKDVFTTAGE